MFFLVGSMEFCTKKLWLMLIDWCLCLFIIISSINHGQKSAQIYLIQKSPESKHPCWNPSKNNTFWGTFFCQFFMAINQANFKHSNCSWCCNVITQMSGILQNNFFHHRDLVTAWVYRLYFLLISYFIICSLIFPKTHFKLIKVFFSKVKSTFKNVLFLTGTQLTSRL